MELDTGAAVSVMTKDTFKKVFPGHLKHLSSTPILLRTYSGEKIKPEGVAKVNEGYNDQSKMLDLYVVNRGGATLFGRE